MRKFVLLFAVVLACLCFFAGCNKPVNYLTYISERRENIYLYSNDGIEIKIYISERENPYAPDGICGDMRDLTEIFVKLDKNYDEVVVSVCTIEGEMNYRAVENCYYLSTSGGNIKGESVDVTLTCGGESKSYSAVSVLYSGVIDCDTAVRCVIDREGELFESLTENKIFCGEVYVRRLYDLGCYYYVGVIDRNKKINAYLVDGERGKIIVSKQLDA